MTLETPDERLERLRAGLPFWYRDKWRRVSANGIEPHGSSKEDPRDPEPEQVSACRAWLREFAAPTKTIRRERSSYQYKHAVEDSARALGVSLYVSNGAFIVAAIAEGYRLERDDYSSQNALFALTLLRKTKELGKKAGVWAAPSSNVIERHRDESRQ